ncbi:MAG: type II toxin-antitoxin system PemK/MazF family toxin [Pirellulales bacterium]
MKQPLRGDVWYVDFDPTRGHEQAGRRPALVISADGFNRGSAGLAVVLPITSKAKGIRSHVPVAAKEGGLTKASYVKCEDIRSVSLQRLGKRLGAVAPTTLATVDNVLRILLDL